MTTGNGVDWPSMYWPNAENFTVLCDARDTIETKIKAAGPATAVNDLSRIHVYMRAERLYRSMQTRSSVPDPGVLKEKPSKVIHKTKRLTH